ncbi:MAG: hypothetical protein NZ651_07140 [Candidatus Bipolaricaulota bacterium]|nr:hypothetical protein [Candidatus Bipolaricaulota bacterium]MDW8127528.1 hypothetical protein [Candidatus Bipolaricaulota bacterium]
MKKLALAALIFGLGAMGFAEGYFVGAEIIPHTFSTATYGIPYLTIGYDAGWGYAYLGYASPGYLNSWISISGGGLWGLTTQTFIGGGVSFWMKLQNFGVETGTWSVNFLGLYKFDSSLAAVLRFHIPLQVDPNKFLMGLWLSFGIEYYIWSGAPTGK